MRGSVLGGRRGSTAAATVLVVLATIALTAVPVAGPQPSTAAGTPGRTGNATPTAGPASPGPLPTAQPASPSPPPITAAYEPFQAPPVPWPLPNLDPGLAGRGPRPALAELTPYLYGGGPVISADPRAGPADWRLARPNPFDAWGYAARASTLPGEPLALCLGGGARSVGLQVFRLGVGDATLMASVPAVQLAGAGLAAPQRADRASGLFEAACPVRYSLDVRRSWRSGVYLVKLTGSGGGQSYLTFVVRPAHPTALVVMLPFMTDVAYNQAGGASLYRRPGFTRDRGVMVSFDRPITAENGAGYLFRAVFPLIAWLEDHGYDPGYVADVDVAADPTYVTGARTVVVAGHAEYWTEGMRQAFLQAERGGTGVVAIGANLAYWQVRLAADDRGAADRTLICYKDAQLDPLAAGDPQAATVQFGQLPRPEPAAEIFGADFLGIVADRIVPLRLRPDLPAFAGATALQPGQLLPALVGNEVDGPTPPGATIRALADTAVALSVAGPPAHARSVLWLSPDGAHVFDAGTLTWSWGLDPRYAAALPGFPAADFARLTAQVLAWAGAQPGWSSGPAGPPRATLGRVPPDEQ